MNANILNAILSLDAYNRGYNPGIAFGSDSQESDAVNNITKVGPATVISSKNDQEAKDGGFYAVAYKIGNEIIISYRGTDSLSGGNGFGNDFWNGYGVGATSVAGKQAELAIKFYREVSNGNPGASISLTGHSLGAGLAGLVAGIYKKSAMLYDNMPFEGAVENTYAIASKTNGELQALSGGSSTTYNALVANRDALKSLVYGTSTPTEGFLFPTSSIKAFHTEGEFLEAFRTSQKTISAVMEHGDGVDLPGLDNGFVRNGWHSMSTLVMLTYVHGSGVSNDWMKSAKYFWPLLYTDTFANSIGVTNLKVPGEDTRDRGYASALRTIIAYSAIGEGERPFGDMAVKYLFDDAGDLGKILNLSNVDSRIVSHASVISEAYVQYAATLALNDTEQYAPRIINFIDGVLKTNNSNSLLTINFSDDLWRTVNYGSLPSMIARADIFAHVLADLGTDADNLRNIMSDIWSDGSANVFEYISYSTPEYSITLANEAKEGRANLHVATDGKDYVAGTSGNDMILGFSGNDDLEGIDGKDIILGGAGDDEIHVGRTISSLVESHYSGGAGIDNLYFDALIGGIGLSFDLQAKTVGSAQGSVHFQANFDGFEKYSLTPYADVISGSAGNDIMYGGEGGDYFYASYGHDLISGNGKPWEEFYEIYDSYTPWYINALDLSVFNTGATVLINDPNAPGDFTGSYYVSGNAASGDFAGIERFVLGLGDDDFYSSPSIWSGDGMGTLFVIDNNKTIYADANDGNDILHLYSAFSVDAASIKLVDNQEFFNFENVIWEETNPAVEARMVIGALGHYFDLSNATSAVIDYSQYAGALDFQISTASIAAVGSLGADDIDLNSDGSFLLAGSDHGDTFHLQSNATLFTGDGNDTVFTSGQGGVSLYYSGGNDHIYLADYDLASIYMPHDIAEGDITETKINVILDESNQEIDWDIRFNIASLGTITVHSTDTVRSDWWHGTFPGSISFSSSSSTSERSPHDNRIVTNYSTSKIQGTSASETLFGNNVRGSDGNDVISSDNQSGRLYGEGGNDTIHGGLSGDEIWGSFGNDQLFGDGGSDYLLGGSGNDYIDGGEYKDYMFGDDGDDTLVVNLDTIYSGNTFNYREVAAGGEGFDTLKLYITDSPLVEAVQQKLETYLSYSHGDRDNAFYLTSDVIISSFEKVDFYVSGVVTELTPTLYGSSYSNNLMGTFADDKLSGLGGSDTLQGLSGNDTYIYDATAYDSGSDTIFETGGIDTVKILGNVSLASLTFARSWNPNDLSIFLDTGGSLVIKNYFVNDEAKIEYISSDAFANFSLSSLRNLQGTENNDNLIGADTSLIRDDYIYAYNGNDVLNGGIGNDALYGGAGNDTYIINHNQGQDYIYDDKGADKIQFGAGINQQFVTYEKVGNDLRIVHGGIILVEVRDHFNGAHSIESIQFSNGSVSTLPSEPFFIEGSSNSDNLSGSSLDDTLNGLADDDHLYGLAGNDTLLGSAGNDFLDGGIGNDNLQGGDDDDEYNFSSDFGSDMVSDASGIDFIKFDSAVGSTDITLTKIDNDLKISFAGSTKSIDIVNQYVSANAIEKIVFFDGTEMLLPHEANEEEDDLGLLARYHSIGNSVSSVDGVDFTQAAHHVEIVSAIDNFGSDPFYVGGPSDWFAVQYKGNLNVQTAGEYVLSLNSDDGSKLFIDGVAVISNDGYHGASEISQTINLSAGQHSIEIQYFEGNVDNVLQFFWRGPDTDDQKQIVSGQALTHSAVNLLPEAFDDYATVGHNSPLTIDVLSNDRDDNGDEVVISSVTASAHGSVAINQNNMLTYTPHTDYVGSDVFSYTIDDGHGGTDTAEVHLNVTGTPTNQDELSGLIASFYLINNSVDSLADINFSVPPVHTETVSSIDNTGAGPFYSGGPNDLFAARYIGNLNIGTAGLYSFSLNSDDGSRLYIDGVAVISNDGPHGSIEITQSVPLTSGTHTIEVQYFEGGYDNVLQLFWNGPDTNNQKVIVAGEAFTHAPQNNLVPTASEDVVHTFGLAPRLIDVLANDVDGNGDDLEIISIGNALHGSVSIVNNKILYTPHNGFSGADSFSYVVDDGHGGVSKSTASIISGGLAETVSSLENFEGAVTGWDNALVDNSYESAFTTILGRYSGSSNDQDVSKTFDLSGQQDFITIDFDLLRFDSWDWGENFNVFINNISVIQDPLQTLPSSNAYGGVAGISYERSYIASGALGVTSYFDDGIYHYKLKLSSNASQIKLGFGTNLDGWDLDESYGIDNVLIKEFVDDGQLPFVFYDFEDGSGTWSNNTTTFSNDTFTGFLGSFDTETSGMVSNNFILSGQQNSVSFAFDLYRLDSWDNGESFTVFVNDTAILIDPVSSISTANLAGTFGTNIAWERTFLSSGELGFAPWADDARYHYEVSIASNATSVKVGFGSNLDQTSDDESWGIDNFVLGEDLTIGTEVTDLIGGTAARDTIHGLDGADTVHGAGGDDVIFGGKDSDILYGDAGADVFWFTISDIGTSDVIKDFNLSQGDQINISDLLQRYDPITDAIEDFVLVSSNGGNSLLSVDATGGGNEFLQITSIEGVSGSTSAQDLVTSGVLIVA